LFEAKISWLGGFFIAQRAAVECAVRARRLSCITAGRYAQKAEAVRIIWCAGPTFGIALGGDLRPNFRPVVSAEWRGYFSMAALVHMSQSVPRGVSIFGCSASDRNQSQFRVGGQELHHHVAPLAPHTRPKPPPKTPPKTPVICSDMGLV
jgi:hypothetical protein